MADLGGWVAAGLPLDLVPSSARGSTSFSATSVSTEKVGSTMKSMKPAAGKGHGGHGEGTRQRRGRALAGDRLGTLTDLRLGHQR